MKTTSIIVAALAALSLGAGIAQAMPKSATPKSGIPSLDGGTATDERILVEARRGGYSYYGPGPDYYKQDRPGPNCYPDPHPVYGYVCY